MIDMGIQDIDVDGKLDRTRSASSVSVVPHDPIEGAALNRNDVHCEFSSACIIQHLNDAHH